MFYFPILYSVKKFTGWLLCQALSLIFQCILRHYLLKLGIPLLFLEIRKWKLKGLETYLLDPTYGLIWMGYLTEWVAQYLNIDNISK